MIQANLIVAAKPPRLVEPAEGSLDDPALGKHLEALDRLRACFKNATFYFNVIVRGKGFL